MFYFNIFCNTWIMLTDMHEQTKTKTTYRVIFAFKFWRYWEYLFCCASVSQFIPDINHAVLIRYIFLFIYLLGTVFAYSFHKNWYNNKCIVILQIRNRKIWLFLQCNVILDSFCIHLFLDALLTLFSHVSLQDDIRHCAKKSVVNGNTLKLIFLIHYEYILSFDDRYTWGKELITIYIYIYIYTAKFNRL